MKLTEEARHMIAAAMLSRGWSSAHVSAQLEDAGYPTEQRQVNRWLAGMAAPSQLRLAALSEILGIAIDAKMVIE